MAATMIANPYPMTDTERTWLYNHHRHLVEIPTVSDPTSTHYNPDNMVRAATFLEDRLKELGFTTRLVRIDGCAPYVLAELAADPNDPTYILYNHYDVQPTEEEHWATDPFTLEEKDGNLYGRGAADNKFGAMATLATIRMAQERGLKLPNLKILFEGEEEAGSEHLVQLFEQEKEFLQAGAMVVMDGEDAEVIASASRGIADVILTVNPEEQIDASSVDSAATLEQRLPFPQRYLHVTLKASALEKPYHSGIGVLLPDCTQALAECVVALETTQVVGKARILDMVAGKPNGGNVIQDSAQCTIAIPVGALEDKEQVLAKIGEQMSAHPFGKEFVWSVEADELLHGPTLHNDSALGLARLIHSLKLPEAIEGLMDGYSGLSDAEREILRNSSQTPEEYGMGKGMLPGTRLRGDESVSVDERIVESPSISILNMRADGSTAKAAISIRTLAGQDPNMIAAVVSDHLIEIALKNDLRIQTDVDTNGAWAWKADIGDPCNQSYLKSLAKGFEKARFQPCGGTNPLLAAIAQIGIPTVVPANQTAGCGAHSHNEYQNKASGEMSIGCYLDFLVNSVNQGG
ncbi:MAG: M20/M25/M40 family metallo-hydrolase [Chlamydiota bacterium]